MRSSVTILAALVPWLVQASPASAQDTPRPRGPAAAVVLERSLIEVTRRVEGSVVAIARYRLPGSLGKPERPGGSPGAADPDHPDFIPNEYGTGIVLSAPDDPSRRLVLTCFHVVRGGPVAGGGAAAGRDPRQRLHVRFANRRGCPARILAADPRSDLAIALKRRSGS